MKLVIEQPGKPNLYQPAQLPGWEFAGVVTRNGYDIGALVRNTKTGIYAKANAGSIVVLDQRSVKAALGEFANAKKLEGGKRVNVYLDAESLETANRIGNGNVSEGIRLALSKAAN